jgi:glycosyltransferase involved in cell wall biosynthesis/peptidoglycan/xylan/chitin deacetylase (PgdA/CDA1 family)
VFEMSGSNDDRPEEANQLRFSVVIPTYQRRDLAVAAVRAFDVQEDVDGCEVIVVVDGSTDDTAEALRQLATSFPLTVLEQPNRGRAAAVNQGAKVARGELLLVVDDDMEADPRLLAEHDRSHREGADVVLGHIPLHPDSPESFLCPGVAAWADRRAERLSSSAAPELGDLVSGQMSLRNDVFRRIGGFDADFTRDGAYGNEDLDLGHRLRQTGQRIVFNERAVSRQRYVVTPPEYLRQWRQGGQADVMLARKHPEDTVGLFHRSRTERPLDRLLLRWLRPALKPVVLKLVDSRALGPRTAKLFFRVVDLEYFQGVREGGGIPARAPVRVLCYHSIADLAKDPVLEQYGVPQPEFRRHLELLDRHFCLIAPDEFFRYLAGTGGVPRKAVLVTFDDCYVDLVTAALPELRARNSSALAFLVTGRVGGTNDWDAHLGAGSIALVDEDGLEALRVGGIAVGAHSRTHPNLKSVSDEKLADEVGGSSSDLKALGVGRPHSFAYPHGEHDRRVTEAVASSGFDFAFTIDPGLVQPEVDRYRIPRVEILRRDSGWRFLWKVFAMGRWDGLRRPGS